MRLGRGDGGRFGTFARWRWASCSIQSVTRLWSVSRAVEDLGILSGKGVFFGCKRTLGRLGSFSVSAAAVKAAPAATAEPFTAVLVDPLGPWRFEAVRFPFEVPDPLVGPRRDLSFWLVTVLEASDRESSMFRGRAGGMVGFGIFWTKYRATNTDQTVRDRVIDTIPCLVITSKVLILNVSSCKLCHE